MLRKIKTTVVINYLLMQFWAIAICNAYIDRENDYGVYIFIAVLTTAIGLLQGLMTCIIYTGEDKLRLRIINEYLETCKQYWGMRIFIPVVMLLPYIIIVGVWTMLTKTLDFILKPIDNKDI